MMVKLEKLGCKKSVVGMVLPTGYTFNADGTCIYLTMAAIFIAQATNTPLTFMDQMILLGVFLLTSKGSAGVAGAGFIHHPLHSAGGPCPAAGHRPVSQRSASRDEFDRERHWHDRHCQVGQFFRCGSVRAGDRGHEKREGGA
jgi:hypothetical protein